MMFQDAIELMSEESPKETAIFAYWLQDSIEKDLDEKLTDQEWSALCKYGNYNMDWSYLLEDLFEELTKIRSKEH